MTPIPRPSLVISENRIRKEFDPQHIMDLVESIKSKGLMHPIVVRYDPGTSSPILVAGENRLRAIETMWELGYEVRCNGTVIPEQSIPTISLGELSPTDAMEAELEENTRRRDLAWQEKASAEAALHKLRSVQAEARGEVQKVADTAKEIHGRADGAYQDSVRKNIILAEHLNRPEVAKAKTAQEAFKILKKQEQTERNAALASAIGTTMRGSSHTLINTECLAWLREQPPEQFDVILTDPPYGMDAQNFGDAGGKLSGTEHTYDDSLEYWNDLMHEWAKLAYAITKPQAHAYVFCDLDQFHALKSYMREAGWYVFRTPFIVHKLNSGRVPLPEYGPRRSWEMLLYAIKGSKPVTHIYPDVIACQGDDNPVHGAQKPVSLYHNLLMRSVRPGDKVLDTFAGAGPIIDAAHQLKCYATAIEMNPALYGHCIKRVQAIDNQGDILAGLN